MLFQVRHTGSIYGLYNWLIFTNPTTFERPGLRFSLLFSILQNGEFWHGGCTIASERIFKNI